MAGAAYNAGDLAQATALMDEVLGLDRTAQDKRGITGSLLNLGQLALDQGQPRRAAALVEEGLVLARELGDVFRISAAVGLLCLVALAEEDVPQASMRSKEALELVLQVDSHEARAWTHHSDRISGRGHGIGMPIVRRGRSVAGCYGDSTLPSYFVISTTGT